MRTQARGLATAVADTVIEKVVSVRWPQRWFRAGWPGVLSGVEAVAGGPLSPPWPDLIVTCGRRSAILGVAVKAAAGGAPLLVHVQDPLTAARRFDLIVAMAHDDIAAPNVIKVHTALHDMTSERRAEAGRVWGPRLGDLPRPLTGVLLGGPTKASPFGPVEGRLLLDRLNAFRSNTGGGAVIVPSRRTPEEVLALFAEAAGSDRGLWVWDRSGDNPYVGVLAVADRLVVTGDSVSMLSEALATPHPVEIFAATVRKRHAGLIQSVVEAGYARIFDGEVSPVPPRPPIDATEDAAQPVRALLASRAG